jgi:uncharacterized Rmd1/YagE family protein
MECLSYCIADQIDLSRLDHHYKNSLVGYVSVKSRDLLKLSPLDARNQVVFVFKNGTVIAWGIKRYQIRPYLDTIQLFANKLITFSVHDEFSYQMGEKTSIQPHDFFDVDCLCIEDDSEELKLSLSYGFSQSVKLQYFETTLEALIEKYTPLIYKLSNKSFPLSRQQIRPIIGELLRANSEMNLISNFLYHPKYFWQHPTLEEHYTMLERYMHIQRRVNAINHRLDTLNEIFDMFNDYLESRHAHRLEVIIIVLIMFEIIFSVMNFHF